MSSEGDEGVAHEHGPLYLSKHLSMRHALPPHRVGDGTVLTRGTAPAPSLSLTDTTVNGLRHVLGKGFDNPVFAAFLKPLLISPRSRAENRQARRTALWGLRSNRNLLHLVE